MRKVFWCCAAGVVAAAGLFYWSADHVVRHPHSFLGRCAVGAYQVLGYTPVSQLGTAMTGAIAQANRCKTSPCEPTATESAVEPWAPGGELSLPVFPDELLDAAQQARLPGKFVIEEDDEAQATPCPKNQVADKPCADQPAWLGEIFGLPVKPDAAGAAEGSEEVSYTMPKIVDADKGPAPTTMPYAKDGEQEDACQGFLNFWTSLFECKSTETGDQEESEPAEAEDPTKCQEDPAYHHQYPGCPYSGACPYTGKCYTPTYTSPKPTVEEESEYQAPKTKTSEPVDSPKSDDDALPPPKVDTTEFRPSDKSPDEGRSNMPY